MERIDVKWSYGRYGLLTWPEEIVIERGVRVSAFAGVKGQHSVEEVYRQRILQVHFQSFLHSTPNTWWKKACQVGDITYTILLSNATVSYISFHFLVEFKFKTDRIWNFGAWIWNDFLFVLEFYGGLSLLNSQIFFLFCILLVWSAIFPRRTFFLSAQRKKRRRKRRRRKRNKKKKK